MKKKISARAKGAAGEREAAQWLKTNLDLAALPERNLEQVRSGGHDLINVDPFCFEIKRCETLSLRDWWVKTFNTARKEQLVPVVMFRQNKQKWEFLISARYIALPVGYIRLDSIEFKKWAKLVLEEHKQGVQISP